MVVFGRTFFFSLQRSLLLPLFRSMGHGLQLTHVLKSKRHETLNNTHTQPVRVLHMELMMLAIVIWGWTINVG